MRCGAIRDIESVTVDENGTKIIDVREGRPGCDETAQAGKERGRVVVMKKGGGIEAGGPRPPGGPVVHIAAGGIVRPAGSAIGSIGVARQCRYACSAFQLCGQRQGIFL